jgi:hypothetical protein
MGVRIFRKTALRAGLAMKKVEEIFGDAFIDPEKRAADPHG